MSKTSSKVHRKTKKSSKNRKGSKKGNSESSNVASEAVRCPTFQQEHQEDTQVIVDSSSESQQEPAEMPEVTEEAYDTEKTHEHQEEIMINKSNKRKRSRKPSREVERLTTKSSEQSESQRFRVVEEESSFLQAQTFILENARGGNDYDTDNNLNINTLPVYDFYERHKYQPAFQSMQKSHMVGQGNHLINIQPQRHNGIKVWLRELFKGNQFVISTVQLKAVEQSDQWSLKEKLISGKRFGIITKALEFNPQYLENNAFSTYTCFLQSTNMVHCLKDMNIPVMTAQQWDAAKPLEDGKPLRPNQYYFIDLGSKVSCIRQFYAVDNCKGSPLFEQIASNRLKYVLHQREPIINKEDYLTSQAFQQRITLDQMQAYIVKMIGRIKKGISLIQGLPGTGKTEILAEIAQNEIIQIRKDQSKLSQSKKIDKIFIVTATNAGADNIYEKILALKAGWKEEKNPPKVLRICHTDQTNEKYLSSNYHHQREIRVLKTQNKPEEWTVTLRSKKKECEESLKRLKAKGSRNRHALRQQKRRIEEYEEKIVKTNEKMSMNRFALEKIEKELMEECDIIICTLNVTGMKKIVNFFRNRVRCLLIDEANQSTEVCTLIPFATLVEKVVLVGNKYSLRPTIKTKLEAFKRSLFERLSAQNQPFILETQYRMTSEILQFPNKEFCLGKLKSMRSTYVPESLSKFNHNVKFCDVTYGVEESCDRDFINRAEVECIRTMIERLIKRDDFLTIGVIAAYKEQVKLIESEIFDLNLHKDVRKNVRVGTIEAFQGLQMEVVIFSTVHSNVKQQIGALYVRKRLNLAFTRAVSAFFVFGSAKTLCGNETWRRFLDHHESRHSIQTIKQGESKTFFEQL